ncbi:MAG: HAMP domain-containing sensor histidine kinase [Bdellovibrionota bacterium]
MAFSLLELIHLGLSLVALAIGAACIGLYRFWKKDELFIVFSVYAHAVAVSLGTTFWLHHTAELPHWLRLLQMLALGVVVPTFYWATRIVLGGARTWMDGAAFFLGVGSFFSICLWYAFWPETLEVITFYDSLGQIFWSLRPREGLPATPFFYILGGGVIPAWFLWTGRQIYFLYRARRRAEFFFALPAVGSVLFATVNDFAVGAGLWRGIFFSYFIFGIMAVTASVWLVYQLILHSTALEDLNRNLERRVEDRTRDLKVANMHLAEADALKSDFLAICSHDLKNLLVSVQGYGEMLAIGILEDAGKEKLREYSDEVQKASKRMLDLIKDLLDSARLESGRVVLHVAPAPLDEVVRDAFEQYVREAADKKIHYNLFLEDGSEHVSMDRSKIQQAVANLLHNAIKFTPAGGEIACSVRRRPGVLEVEVRDSGKGIPPEDQKIVFDKFAIARKRRTDRSTSLGTGLGLSITKTFIELHGGTIRLDSEVGRGTRFTIRFPGAAAAAAPVDPT